MSKENEIFIYNTASDGVDINHILVISANCKLMFIS